MGADPEGFSRSWESQQAALREQVLRAQALLPKVTIAEGLLLLISELCCSQGVASLRADLVMNKAARALAALEGRTSVEPDDLSQAAMLVFRIVAGRSPSSSRGWMRARLSG